MARKTKIKKKMKKKTPGDVIILYMCTKNYYHIMYSSWDMVCDRQTDGQKKWHIEVEPLLKLVQSIQ